VSTYRHIPWRPGVTLERLNSFAKDTMVETLDIVFTELATDHVKARMPVTAKTVQPRRILHGGASVVLAETIGSVAANACLDDEHSAVGQEINANHLRPVKEGDVVTGVGRLVHAGARSQVWHIELFDSAEQLTCISRLTMAVVKRR
jgi:1,4-dihydroxy-2-naphthoyl-CoA hydrolase